MSEWNSTQYLKFKKERTQPAIDLVNRISSKDSKRIIDIGCGPGNSTKVLADAFPDSYIVGIDNSENMIATATANYPSLDFKLCNINTDLATLGHDFDIVFSNACIQWVPNHRKLLRDLMDLLKEDGILAIQVPMNYNMPIHKTIREISRSQTWEGYFPNPQIFHTLSHSEYFDILSEISQNISIWETIYYHIMETHNDILEWYRGTGLRPYLNVLTEDKKSEFESTIMADVVSSYPMQKNGEIIFRFPRLFFIATRN